MALRAEIHERLTHCDIFESLSQEPGNFEIRPHRQLDMSCGHRLANNYTDPRSRLLKSFQNVLGSIDF